MKIGWPPIDTPSFLYYAIDKLTTSNSEHSALIKLTGSSSFVIQAVGGKKGPAHKLHTTDTEESHPAETFVIQQLCKTNNKQPV